MRAQTNSSTKAVVLLVLAAVFASGCAPMGRIMDPSEVHVISSSRAETATFDRLVQETTTRLLRENAAQPRAQGAMKIAFVGIENSSREEIRDVREAVTVNIDSAIVNSRLFTSISAKFVNAARRHMGNPPTEDLFLAKPRAEFMSLLGREGMTPDYFLWAQLTTKSSQAGSIEQVTYQLSLELVNANTGETANHVTAELRKEYRR